MSSTKVSHRSIPNIYSETMPANSIYIAKHHSNVKYIFFLDNNATGSLFMSFLFVDFFLVYCCCFELLYSLN